MQQHLYTVAMETRYNSTYTQWLVSSDASARTHSGWRAQIQQHSPTVASEPRCNSTYTQWLDSPDADSTWVPVLR